MIRKYEDFDLTTCAQIMIQVYNNELWQSHWTLEIAKSYLQDFVSHAKFIGYTLLVGDEIVGAIFAHEKIWWNNSEVFIEEMFISPKLQRQGYGTELIHEVESYINEHKLAGFTLATNRFAPAPDFYRKNGFVDYDHVLFMGKEVM